MKTLLITISVVAILAALAYLIWKNSKPVSPPVVEVTTPPATIVQPVIIRRGSQHTHPPVV